MSTADHKAKAWPKRTAKRFPALNRDSLKAGIRSIHQDHAVATLAERAAAREIVEAQCLSSPADRCRIGSTGAAATSGIKAESRSYFKALGAHICRLRKDRELTQAELARAIGVSQQAIFAYELGERRVSVLLLTKIARVFSMSVAELVGMARPVRVAKTRVSARAEMHAQRLHALSTTQQRFVIRIIETLEDANRDR